MHRPSDNHDAGEKSQHREEPASISAGRGYRTRSTERRRTSVTRGAHIGAYVGERDVGGRARSSVGFGEFAPRRFRAPESAGVAEQPADDVCRLLVCTLGAVGVDLHRGGAVGVAKPRGHRRHGHAGVEELRGLEVAEVVEPD